LLSIPETDAALFKWCRSLSVAFTQHGLPDPHESQHGLFTFIPPSDLFSSTHGFPGLRVPRDKLILSFESVAAVCRPPKRPNLRPVHAATGGPWVSEPEWSTARSKPG